jgi:hypothetical protein
LKLVDLTIGGSIVRISPPSLTFWRLLMDLSFLPFWLRLLLGAAVLIFLTPLIIGPFLLRTQHRIERGFRIDARFKEHVPAQVLALVEQARPILESAGFQWLGHYRLSNYAPGTQAWFGLWRHATAEGLAAMTAAIYQIPPGPDAEPIFALSYAELSGLFEDGFCLCVNNAAQSGAFDSQQKLLLRYPELSMAGLLENYNQIVRRHPRCKKYQPILPGQEIAQIRQQMLKELDLQVKDGIYRHEDQAYRLTWTGAIVMTIRHLPPFTWLREALESRNASRWAREIA